MVRYSLLTSDESIFDNKEYISELLCQGVKILVFSVPAKVAELKSEFAVYVGTRLLQLFDITQSVPVITIEDGYIKPENNVHLKELSERVPAFNYEQYLIEHADANNSLMVEAGAGTGKTTVMIDRILFLLHTVPDLRLEDIGVITFTNEATQNMKHKLQAALTQRYYATKAPRYLRFLEDSAKIHIQTIHSFSRSIINELGTSIGYANALGLRSFKFEKRQIIHDVLNEKYLANRKSLPKGLGAQLHELDRLILDFWTQLENIGLTDEEIAELDWGLASNSASKALHQTLSTAFSELNDRYNTLKLEEDSIAVGDIVRELRRILDTGSELIIKEKKLKYLFVDEFQDSDNAQIKTIAWLHRVCGLQLFAVGDTKQSIYRFRGAVETAFDKLRAYIAKNTSIKPNEFTLRRNYRTSRDVLDAIDPIFRQMERSELLEYGQSLVAQKQHVGQCAMRHVRKSNAVIQSEAIRTMQRALADCKAYAEANNKLDDPTQHVTVLTRTNFQLSRVADWCEAANIPCYIKKEGSFYSSKPVKDFFCLVKAYVFPEEACHLFDYLDSSYVAVDFGTEDVRGHGAGTSEQLNKLKELVDERAFEWYQREFRLKPVISVLHEMVNDADPTSRYISLRRQQLLNSVDWEEDDLEQQLAIEASQYDADLEKLFQILRKHFSGQMVSLYQIYSFLKVQIATNTTEDEPDVSGQIGCGCIYGMTVHKAKGLEFDTVLLPFTHRLFRKELDTELLLDETKSPVRVGWSRVVLATGSWTEVEEHQCNDYYMDCLEKEFHDVDREEARLLYVALTRAIRRLECFIVGDEVHSWAHMLEG